jgi:hypothetical protein
MRPLQPIYRDCVGIERFQPNLIVVYLLEVARGVGVDLNTLGMRDFPQEDREQFAQLIGYTLSGFSELSYVSDETYARVEEAAKEIE